MPLLLVTGFGALLELGCACIYVLISLQHVTLRDGFIFKTIGFMSLSSLWVVDSYGSCRCACQF